MVTFYIVAWTDIDGRLRASATYPSTEGAQASYKYNQWVDMFKLEGEPGTAIYQAFVTLNPSGENFTTLLFSYTVPEKKKLDKNILQLNVNHGL